LSAAAAAVILKRTINATRPIYFLYQVLEIALFPGVALYLLYRGIRDPGYFTALKERFGFADVPVETTGAGSIWFHAVSVGEVLSLVQLLRRVRAENPTVPLFVSTATLAGRATAEQKLAGLADGIFLAPLDYRSAVQRVLRCLRPSLVVVLETEIWPNLYRESKRAGASLVVVNGRISDRALPRYRRWSWFFRHVLRWPDTILVQTEEDARRYVIAGAPGDRVRVGGNMKYDFTPPEGGIVPEIVRFLDGVRPAKIWIAASTTAPVALRDVDEDDAVIAAFSEISASEKGLLLILAPRKPERFDVVAARLERAGVRYTRRSALHELELPGVLLLDPQSQRRARGDGSPDEVEQSLGDRPHRPLIGQPMRNRGSRGDAVFGAAKEVPVSASIMSTYPRPAFRRSTPFDFEPEALLIRKRGPLESHRPIVIGTT
jgi:3-deoxy-D-manno-octulosonic-acid transferase